MKVKQKIDNIPDEDGESEIDGTVSKKSVITGDYIHENSDDDDGKFSDLGAQSD